MVRKKYIYLFLLPLLIVGNLIAVYRASPSLQATVHQARKQWTVRNEEVIISLSTTPQRINNIEPTIKSLLAQNLRHKKIYLSIPYIFKRDNSTYVIPDWLRSIPQVTILRTEDYGPVTKLFGVLEQLNLNPEAIIITVDDDNEYPKDHALNLVYNAVRNPNAVIGLSGVNPDYDPMGNIKSDSKTGLMSTQKIHRLPNNGPYSILHGFAGIAYRRKFFDAKIFQISNSPTDCIKSDDIYIAYYLAEKGIPRKLADQYKIVYDKIKFLPLAFGVDSLRSTDQYRERHANCIAFLKTSNPNVEF